MPDLRIDPADRLRIENAVHNAEQNTSGEIVVLVVDACDGYRGARLRAAVSAALLFSLGTLALGWDFGGLALVGIQVSVGLLALGACRFDPVLRLFLSEALMQRRAEQRAAAGFHQHGLSRTAGRTGVLLFVARLEHRVIVLADDGVDHLLDSGVSWDDVVGRVLDEVQRTRLVEGIVAGSEEVGRLLARHLPAPPRNPDELPTALVVEDH